MLKSTSAPAADHAAVTIMVCDLAKRLADSAIFHATEAERLRKRWRLLLACRAAGAAQAYQLAAELTLTIARNL